MARTNITPQTPAVTGTVVTLEAANVAGNSVFLGVPGVKRLLVVLNGSGGAITITMGTPGKVAGLDIADRTVVVAAGAREYILLDDVLRRSDDYAYVDYSAVTSVTVAVISV